MMFEHLPEINSRDIAYTAEVQLPKLLDSIGLEAPADIETGLNELCRELDMIHPEYGEVVRRGVGIVLAIDPELPDNMKLSLAFGVAAAQLAVLSLVSRSIEATNLPKY